VKKNRKVYVCNACSAIEIQWAGQCSSCKSWNTLEEEHQDKAKLVKIKNVKNSKKITEITIENHARSKTGLNEFDRVVGDGVVAGSLILIGGEPGIGKSTLLTEVMGRFSYNYPKENVLYTSGEESLHQIASRLNRLDIAAENFYLINETNWQTILSEIKLINPKFLVLDSIQTIYSSDVLSSPGTISQIREVTHEIMNYVKANGITCFIIGHITKEGSIAGPKILEHMVDTVIYFEGDQYDHYRILRVIKNRFGNTNEIGIFEMSEKGLVEVKNPSQYFLEDQLTGSYGKALSCILEGSRPILIEIQSLVVENKSNNSKRTTQGFDNNRLNMLIAIVEKYFSIPLGYNDIYLNIIGGLKVTGREVDLSIIASLISSYRNKPINPLVMFIGEVGLTGEIRSVPLMEQRLKEISYLNYKKLITSKQTAKKFHGKFSIEIIGIKSAIEVEGYI